MTNSRAIHSAATSEANTFTHHDVDHQQTRDRHAEHQPIEQKPHDGRDDAAGRSANGCSSFWNLNRDLSGGGGATTSVGRRWR